MPFLMVPYFCIQKCSFLVQVSFITLCMNVKDTIKVLNSHSQERIIESNEGCVLKLYPEILKESEREVKFIF